MNARYSQHGFTLLELLVALAVFALMSVMAYGGLRTLLDSREQTDRLAREFAELQQVLLFLEQDLNQAAYRAVRDELGDPGPMFAGGAGAGSLIELTRGGVAGPGDYFFQRVAYRFEGEKLQRLRWAVLDRVQGSEPIVMNLMNGVQDAQVRFLGEEWEPGWDSSNSQVGEGIPRAVEIVLVTRNWGEIRRLIPVYP
jgi:general secretion pathway protein J